VLSLVLPTYNEAKNIPELLPKLEEILTGIEHEIIIVDDDSPDGTWHIALELAQGREDLHVIRRLGRRGLSSAVIEGFLAAKGDVFAVMDADGQHDFELLPALYHAVRSGSGIAVGSRYVEGGSVGEWDERRQVLSRIATRLALFLCAVKVKDPMSGFFAIERSLFERVVTKLNPKGFKILLDLLVCVPRETQVTEHPFTFRKRLHGQSKLSLRVQVDFLEYLYDVTVGKYIPLTFVKYSLVGTLGVFVHLCAYYAITRFVLQSSHPSVGGFSIAVIGATETAIVFNFFLNNIWTFAGQRLQGKQAAVGFLKFNIACLFGALVNWGVSTSLFALKWQEFLAVFLGAMAGVMWNYTVNRIFTWKE